LKICVAGWYFEKELIEQLKQINSKYPVTFLTSFNAKDKIPEDIGLDSYALPIAGLEFAKYDHYIKNIWDGENVLFMHDDIICKDIKAFDRIAELKHDQAFIFESEAIAKQNQNFHGRMIYGSAKFIRFALDYVCTCSQTKTYVDGHHNMFCSLKCFNAYDVTMESVVEARPVEVTRKNNAYCTICRKKLDEKHIGLMLRGCGPHKGFWFDPWNDGRHARGKVPLGLRHYNDGIYHFAMFAKRCRSGIVHQGKPVKMDADVKVYMPEFIHGRRGVYGKRG